MSSLQNKISEINFLLRREIFKIDEEIKNIKARIVVDFAILRANAFIEDPQISLPDSKEAEDEMIAVYTKPYQLARKKYIEILNAFRSALKIDEI